MSLLKNCRRGEIFCRAVDRQRRGKSVHTHPPCALPAAFSRTTLSPFSLSFPPPANRLPAAPIAMADTTAAAAPAAVPAEEPKSECASVRAHAPAII